MTEQVKTEADVRFGFVCCTSHLCFRMLNTHTHIYTHIYTYTYIYTHIHIYIYIHRPTYPHAYTRTYTHTSIHIYTHTHIYKISIHKTFLSQIIHIGSNYYLILFLSKKRLLDTFTQDVVKLVLTHLSIMLKLKVTYSCVIFILMCITKANPHNTNKQVLVDTPKFMWCLHAMWTHAYF